MTSPTPEGQRAGKPTAEDRRRALYAALEVHLRELGSIQRMYPRRSIGSINVGQAAEQVARAMNWTMEGVAAAPTTSGREGERG